MILDDALYSTRAILRSFVVPRTAQRYFEVFLSCLLQLETILRSFGESLHNSGRFQSKTNRSGRKTERSYSRRPLFGFLVARYKLHNVNRFFAKVGGASYSTLAILRSLGCRAMVQH